MRVEEVFDNRPWVEVAVDRHTWFETASCDVGLFQFGLIRQTMRIFFFFVCTRNKARRDVTDCDANTRILPVSVFKVQYHRVLNIKNIEDKSSRIPLLLGDRTRIDKPFPGMEYVRETCKRQLLGLLYVLKYFIVAYRFILMHSGLWTS